MSISNSVCGLPDAADNERVCLEAHDHVELLSYEHRDVGVARALVERHMEALVVTAQPVEHRREAHELARVGVADGDAGTAGVASCPLTGRIGQTQNLSRVAQE